MKNLMAMFIVASCLLPAPGLCQLGSIGGVAGIGGVVYPKVGVGDSPSDVPIQAGITYGMQFWRGYFVGIEGRIKAYFSLMGEDTTDQYIIESEAKEMSHDIGVQVGIGDRYALYLEGGPSWRSSTISRSWQERRNPQSKGSASDSKSGLGFFLGVALEGPLYSTRDSALKLVFDVRHARFAQRGYTDFGAAVKYTFLLDLIPLLGS